MVLHHLLSMTLALLIDRLVGDPPSWPHPVRWMGSLVSQLERWLNRGRFRKAKGVLLLIITGFVACAVTFLIVWGAYQLHVLIGITLEAMIIATTIAQRGLKHAAMDVYQPLNHGDRKEARKQVSWIVGRDTEHLQESGITRATVETVAENISDGVTAPLFWSLVGGAPLAVVYRAVNTSDSMVGYRNERYEAFGWASARVDDLVNWLPSRITGVCMIVSTASSFMTKREAFSYLRREASKHPSPNSGWGESAVALLLGAQLGGVNYYQGVKSERAVMGQAWRPLNKQDIVATISVMQRSVGLFFIMLWIGGGSFAVTGTWF